MKKRNSIMSRQGSAPARLVTVISLIVCMCLSWAGLASADVVTDWNKIASDTAVPVRPGPSAMLDLAMVQVAMHDAIQAFQGRFELYAGPIPNASGSPVAAAASAAHDVLAARFPSQSGTLDTTLNTYLSGLGLQFDVGVLIGQQAAANILNLRAGDGSFPANPEVFVGGTGPGEWRPTPPTNAPMATPWLGAVTPFTINDATQLRASPPPPSLSSGEYVHDYDEVKALGRINSTARTQAQTDLSLFYSDNFIALWERTLRGIADANINNIGDSARLFALANLAAADAIIAAWDGKRYWHFWRPITAIQQGDNDGNPQTAGDATWLPLIPTPPYPEFPSGANSLTGAMTRILKHFFGDTMTFSVISAAVNQTRTYDHFSDMADDVVNVRIYQGIHFRTADEVARDHGKRVADFAFSHFLRPVQQ
jgi:hypothetical protein